MLPPTDDTIVAVASAPGGALRGIVRLSGPRVVPCLAQCFEAASGDPLDSIRRPSIVAGQVRIAGDVPLDALLYLWPTSASYTRQPAAELHTLGSPPLVDAVVQAIVDRGARLARPGEFTLLAFLAGRLDLTAAEAVLGVIDAHDERQLNAALVQLAGGLATPLGKLRDDLLDLTADVEAALDFADEAIEFVPAAELARRLDDAARQIDALHARLGTRAAANTLPRVVLVGRPNVGKSSLLNALLGRSAAIVHSAAGTTRDYVAETCDLDGVACQLIDTAGIGSPAVSPIDAAAQNVSIGQRAAADVELVCLDLSTPPTSWEHEQLHAPAACPRLFVGTKSDLLPQWSRDDLIAASAQTGSGIHHLRARLRELLSQQTSATGDCVLSTALRSASALARAAEAIRQARSLVDSREPELLAAELRAALEGLGEVLGTVLDDDILDHVFSRFCIGK